MKTKYGELFGALIAGILLILYSFTVFYMMWEVLASAKDAPGKALEFPGGIVFVVTTVGGLVSALVIAKLAITVPNENPAVVQFAVRDDGTQSGWVTFLVWAYLAIWLIAGLAALVIGVMIYPDVSHTLSDIGTTWLGLAAAAGYAYFGITPQR
ncbi:MAG: hypothetical protein JSW59_05555 [Phycisphaerales bacterium]|nr:MAG: hypothetical protein JSW59_05555 [Phycisphaerales bacterium]